MKKSILLCAGANGRAVVFGDVKSEPVSGEPVMLTDARMVLRWSAECGGIFGLAANGPAQGTELTATVSKTCSVVWAQWLEVPAETAQKFRNWQ